MAGRSEPRVSLTMFFNNGSGGDMNQQEASVVEKTIPPHGRDCLKTKNTIRQITRITQIHFRKVGLVFHFAPKSA